MGHDQCRLVLLCKSAGSFIISRNPDRLFPNSSIIASDYHPIFDDQDIHVRSRLPIPDAGIAVDVVRLQAAWRPDALLQTTPVAR